MQKPLYKYIKILTFIGISAVLILQSIWLYNTYLLIRDNIRDECSSIVEYAVDEEMRLRLNDLPDEAQVIGGETSETRNPLTSFCEALSDMGYKMSLAKIDSIAAILLKEHNIKSRSVVYLVNPLTNDVLGKSREEEIVSWSVIRSQPFPVRVDMSEAVQLVISNPTQTFFARMGILIVVSILMLVLIIGCIAYQIKVIIYQRRVAKLREDFSYAMVHDMKTPLSTITLCANFLSSEKAEAMPDLKEEFGKAIRSESTHLLRLTNKLLTLSKLESHTLVMQKEKVQLRPMVEKIVETFRLKSDRPVRFVLDLRAEELTADREHLEESVYNLVDNAVKYAKDDGEIEITVTSETDEANGYIRVRDNGIGISRQDRKKIFDKFERGSALSSSRFGKVAGFGLGLSYVYRVAEAHGGTVLVHSVVGEFSEFTILIPQVMEEYNENETENYGA